MRKCSLLLLFFVVVLCTPALSQDVSFEPANFGALENLSRLAAAPPDREPGDYDVFVPCQGFVEVDGSLTDYHCMTVDMPEHGDFVKSVYRALHTQDFKAAKVNGEPVRVFFSFGALFRCTAQDCSIYAVPNQLRHLEDFGAAYFAPQPILAEDSWYVRFDKKLRRARDAVREDLGPIANRHRADIGFVVSVEVREDGTARRGRVVDYAREWRSITATYDSVDYWEIRQFAAEAADSIDRARFIPGFHEGRPTRMRAYDYFFMPLAVEKSTKCRFHPTC